MQVEEWQKAETIFWSDSCLTGAGGWFVQTNTYVHTIFPEFILQKKLHIKCT